MSDEESRSALKRMWKITSGVFLAFFLRIALKRPFWIYENGIKELDPKHSYFTLISLNLQAFLKPSKREDNRERRAMKGR